MMINIDIGIVAPGHGSLSSLASLGHFSSVSFISEEKTSLEIQKLRQELIQFQADVEHACTVHRAVLIRT